jgi:hypothetical protein
MFSWLYDLLMPVITFILSFFGINLKEKSVRFADDTKDSESSTTHPEVTEERQDKEQPSE